MKCGNTTQHQGRPRKNGKSKPYGHGWFMLVNPKDLRVLGVTKGVNLFAAEQVFSWFRNYARLLNEARPERHAFKVLYFVKQHNQNLQDKKATYLNKYQASFKKGSKKHACNSNVIKNMKAAKTMKHMKSIKAMKSAKGTKAMKSMKK